MEKIKPPPFQTAVTEQPRDLVQVHIQSNRFGVDLTVSISNKLPVMATLPVHDCYALSSKVLTFTANCFRLFMFTKIIFHQALISEPDKRPYLEAHKPQI